MPRPHLAPWLLAALLTVAPGLAGHAQSAPTPPIPVLVELFTSEGCSSCPPADDLLAHLSRTQPVPGALVIALGEHVDYWNGPRWSDPFSSHALTARQNEYAGFFHNDTVYTPQMIVDGRTEFIGSDAGRALSAIAHASRAPLAQVEVSRGLSPGSNETAVTITVRGLPRVTPGDAADVWMAVTEDGLRSDVTGGENRGRRLTHVAVVRTLRRVGTASPGRDWSAQASVPLPPAVRGTATRLVAFVQERDSRRVLGIGMTSL